MERNDDNNDIIRKARQKAKAEKEKKDSDNLTEDKNKEEVNKLKEDKIEETDKDRGSEEVESSNEETIDNEDCTEQIEIEELKNKTTNKYKKKIYIGIVCSLVLIGIMYFSARRYDNLVYPDITLYNVDVSNLNEKELNNKINNIYNDINNSKITVKVGDKQYEIKVSEIVKKIDKNKTEKEIMTYGKNKFFMEQFGLIYLNVNRNYNFDIKIDNNVLQSKVNEIYEETSIFAVEPTLEVNGEKVTVISGKNGKGIDKENLVNQIIAAINSDDIGKTNIVIKEEFKTIRPKINEDDLKNVKDKISSATTYFGGSGYNRGLNIANAASKINGTLLMPGEEFSYEDTVSPVELYNGYYMAPVIVNGTHKNAPGGGVCQVSTTLYNAELKAGILPTERHNHSKAISYVQKGLDATLATGSKDLRFKNPYKYPIYIRAYTVGGQITVEIWSNKSVLDGKKYTPVSFVKGSIANTYLYGYNSNGELVYKKFIDTSIYK